MVLERDRHKCTYCLVDVAEDSYVLDHIVPVSKGGTNKKFNLVTSCQGCNQRKQDEDAIKFLSTNYRAQLISQEEYLKQKDYIENLITQQS
ncbi:MAG: HNH endonuclease [Deltaproteobacteria bacterium]|nr:HNH endonuclease [Deltaproteobacteria bacterium]